MHKATLYTAILLTALVLTATDATASDNVYRWVDEQGNVHFGDNPPGKTKAEVVDIQPGPTISSQPVAETVPVATDAQPSRAQQQRDERETRRKENAERQQALAAGCAQRHQLVSQLEPSTRVMIKDKETGQVTRMDDNERLKTLGEAKAYIAENCKK
jgi:hypothetical protein